MQSISRVFMPSMLLMLSLAASVASVACASAGASATTNSAADAPKRDRNTILAEDMRDLTVANLYEAVQRLHPEWLNARNSATIGKRSGLSNDPSNDIQVYVGSQRLGNTDMLKSMTLNTASALRFYSASEAQARFGTGNLNGVIQVVLVAK